MAAAYLWDVNDLGGLWLNTITAPMEERIGLTDALILAMSMMLPPPLGIIILAASRAVR